MFTLYLDEKTTQTWSVTIYLLQVMRQESFLLLV